MVLKTSIQIIKLIIGVNSNEPENAGQKRDEDDDEDDEVEDIDEDDEEEDEEDDDKRNRLLVSNSELHSAATKLTPWAR